MTDQRMRDLERRARQGEPGARAALEAALSRLQSDPSLDALWVAVVEALEDANELASARLELPEVARAVLEVAEGDGSVRWAWAPGPPPQSRGAPIALVVGVGEDVVVSIACGPTVHADPGWIVEPPVAFAVPETIQASDTRSGGRFVAELLGDASAADDYRAWAEQPDTVEVTVRSLADWYSLRLDWHVTTPASSMRCRLARRLRTTASLASSWAREALA